MQVQDETVPSFVNSLLDQVAKNEGFVDCKISPYQGSKHGDGFLSYLQGYNIEGYRVTSNGQKKFEKLSVLCKLPPSNETRRDLFNTLVFFERETIFYSKVLPYFVKYQHQLGISLTDGFYGFPKCYATVFDKVKNEFVIIMEDMRELNYLMFDKLKPVDFSHAKMMMEALGRLHGLSLALKQTHPQEFNQFKNMPDLFYNLMATDVPLKEFLTKSIEKAINAIGNDLDKKYTDKLQYVLENITKVLADCADIERAEPFAVVNHGDCWNNNMLYNYDKNGNPDKICLLDYQIGRYSSPALDLVYYMFSSTNKELRDKHYNDLLKSYHNSLVKIIKQCGVTNAENIFTYADLLDQLKKFGKFAMITGPLIVQMIVMDPHDIPDLDDISENAKEKSNGVVDVNLFSSEKSAAAYKKRITDCIRDIVDYGFI